MEANPAIMPRARSAHSAREQSLRKHADYQRVYREGRRQSLPLMTYFFALRTPSDTARVEARVGLTAGKVLGNAVARNRIKRRMRAAVDQHRAELTGAVDVILHPRRTVLDAEFTAISREVMRAFLAVESAVRAGTAIGPEDKRQRFAERPRPKAAAGKLPEAKTVAKNLAKNRSNSIQKSAPASPLQNPGHGD